MQANFLKIEILYISGMLLFLYKLNMLICFIHIYFIEMVTISFKLTDLLRKERVDKNLHADSPSSASQT